jgi:hypothetical protein
MYQFERPPHIAYAGLGDVRCTRIRRLHDYWRGKCRDDRPPPREAIEPGEIRPLLPHLILAELGSDPFRIVYRLVGTAVAKSHKQDFTGRDHESVESLAGSGLDQAFRQAMVGRAPAFGRTALYAGDHSWLLFEYAVLPLSEDGVTVNKCLAIESTAEAEPQSWTPSTDDTLEGSGSPR